MYFSINNKELNKVFLTFTTLHSQESKRILVQTNYPQILKSHKSYKS